MKRKTQRFALDPITANRTVRIYATLWDASNSVLERGIENKPGSKWLFLSSIVLTSLALEAYLNHVGFELEEQNLLPICWECFERLPALDKVLKISEALGVKFDRGVRPFQTLETLKSFRDLMVHGNFETIQEKPNSEPGETNNWIIDHCLALGLFAEWEEQIATEEFANLVRTDVKEILEKLHDGLFPLSVGFHVEKL